MKLGTATAMAVVGVDAAPVRIEAALLPGLPAFHIVGLPDTAVSESRERVRAAFAAAGITFPAVRITVNLSPADTPKYGTRFDLGIAAAVLASLSGQPGDPSLVMVGELGLDGSVRDVPGILPAALGARRAGFRRVIVPRGCLREARLGGAEVRGVWHLAQLAEMYHVAAVPVPEPPVIAAAEPRAAEPALDMADVHGQTGAKLALELAAAGGHHLYIVGPPGVGKSMLACRVPGILPPLTREEGIQVAAVRSVLGTFDGDVPTVRPFASPHHTASAAALVGGGGTPRPGAVTRADHGVLFLDELPEFSTAALQALREPMETGVVSVYRARRVTRFPARFQLIAAANPCRCGRALDGDGSCTCTSASLRAYRAKVGGPLLDRFDLRVVLHRPTAAELAGGPGEASENVRARVIAARERQRVRFAGEAWSVNAQAPGKWLRAHTDVPRPVAARLDRAVAAGALTARGMDKILRLAWTVADVQGRAAPGPAEFDVAFGMRAREGMDV